VDVFHYVSVSDSSRVSKCQYTEVPCRRHTSEPHSVKLYWSKNQTVGMNNIPLVYRILTYFFCVISFQCNAILPRLIICGFPYFKFRKYCIIDITWLTISSCFIRCTISYSKIFYKTINKLFEILYYTHWLDNCGLFISFYFVGIFTCFLNAYGKWIQECNIKIHIFKQLMTSYVLLQSMVHFRFLKPYSQRSQTMTFENKI